MDSQHTCLNHSQFSINSPSVSLLNMHTTKMSRTIRIFVALICILTISLCLYLVITFQLNDAEDTDTGMPHIITIIADDMVSEINQVGRINYVGRMYRLSEGSYNGLLLMN